MRRPEILLAIVALLCLPVHTVRAASPRTASDDLLRVFIDCVDLYCDTDFLRTEIGFVDHVRQREVADVHVLVTAERTGSGGRQYTVQFLGQHAYATRSDTARFDTAVDASDDDTRRQLARTIKLGLVRYVMATPTASRLDVTLAAAAPAAAAATTRKADPWDYWVFRIQGNAFMNGEKSTKFLSSFGSVSANRTTNAWKHDLSFNGNYSESRFVFETGHFNSYSHGYSFNTLDVKSLTAHWSLGARSSIGAFTRTNEDLVAHIAPAIEYNVFRYSENTRRSLTFQYSAGPTYFAYTKETIFDRMSETRASEALAVAYNVKQRWGSISTSVEGSHYFHDLSKQRVQSFTSMDVRLFKGLSLNLFGSAALIRDQLFLPKVGATQQEILLQRRQLATSYQYFASVGLTYSFGSIYNNIVNTRFGGAGGFFGG